MEGESNVQEGHRVGCGMSVIDGGSAGPVAFDAIGQLLDTNS